MKPVNLLLTLLSLNAVLVIIERLSPTTNIFLQPYKYLRVHEVFQMTVVIMLSFIISFLLLKVVSRNFELMKSRKGTILGIIFILGVYFTATGNGLHEVASHLFNTFCRVKEFLPLGNGIGNLNHPNTACGSMFINDYYFGNIVYFVGLLLGNISLILFERINPDKTYKGKDLVILIVNSLIYALTFIAYAALDPVLVGVWFLIIAAIICDYLLVSAKAKWSSLPFTLYSAVGYTLAAIITLFLRFR